MSFFHFIEACPNKIGRKPLEFVVHFQWWNLERYDCSLNRRYSSTYMYSRWLVCIVDVTLRKNRILYFNGTLTFFIDSLIYTVVIHTKAWFSWFKGKTRYRRWPGLLYIAFKAGIACFWKICWEPGFTGFVTSTLFNQPFAQLVQPWRFNPG